MKYIWQLALKFIVCSMMYTMQVTICLCTLFNTHIHSNSLWHVSNMLWIIVPRSASQYVTCSVRTFFRCSRYTQLVVILSTMIRSGQCSRCKTDCIKESSEFRYFWSGGQIWDSGIMGTLVYIVYSTLGRHNFEVSQDEYSVIWDWWSERKSFEEMS